MIRCGSFLFNVIVSMVTVSLNSYGVSQSKTYHTFESYRLTSIELLCYSSYQGRTRGSVSFSLLRRLQNPTLDLAHRGGGPSTPRDIGIKGVLRTATLSPRPRPRPVASALQVSQHLNYECNTLRRIATPQTTIVGAKSRQPGFLRALCDLCGDVGHSARRRAPVRRRVHTGELLGLHNLLEDVELGRSYLMRPMVIKFPTG